MCPWKIKGGGGPILGGGEESGYEKGGEDKIYTDLVFIY